LPPIPDAARTEAIQKIIAFVKRETA